MPLACESRRHFNSMKVMDEKTYFANFEDYEVADINNDAAKDYFDGLSDDEIRDHLKEIEVDALLSTAEYHDLNSQI